MYTMLTLILVALQKKNLASLHQYQISKVRIMWLMQKLFHACGYIKYIFI